MKQKKERARMEQKKWWKKNNVPGKLPETVSKYDIFPGVSDTDIEAWVRQTTLQLNRDWEDLRQKRAEFENVRSRMQMEVEGLEQALAEKEQRLRKNKRLRVGLGIVSVALVVLLTAAEYRLSREEEEQYNQTVQEMREQKEEYENLLNEM